MTHLSRQGLGEVLAEPCRADPYSASTMMLPCCPTHLVWEGLSLPLAHLPATRWLKALTGYDSVSRDVLARISL